MSRLPHFDEWHRAKLGRLPPILRGTLWFMCGFIWIPLWYVRSRANVTPISKLTAWMLIATVCGLATSANVAQIKWDGYRQWQRLQNVSGVEELKRGLAEYLSDPVLKGNIATAREALQNLNDLDQATRALTGRTRAMVAEHHLNTDCRADTQSCIRVGASAATIIDRRGDTTLEVEPVTLQSLESALDLVRSPDYVIFVDEQLERVGMYTDGAPASRIKWRVYIGDYRTREILADTSFVGLDPPSQIRHPGGSTGQPPRTAFMEWVRGFGLAVRLSD